MSSSLAQATLITLLLCQVHGVSAQVAPDCSDTAAAEAYWRAVYVARATDETNANALVEELLPCLGSENPVLRDTYGYGLFTFWLRNDRLDLDARQTLSRQLEANLDSGNVFLRSFSALVLSEILRADGIEAFLTGNDRDRLQQSSSRALIAETDFRGLDAGLGWVHPVAHMADVHWRLALHPQLTSQQAHSMMDAIAAKATTTAASYVFNESERLARVVAILIRREILAPDGITSWLDRFATRRDGSEWSTVFADPAGMAELHNTKAFMRALSEQLAQVEIDESLREQIDGLLQLFRDLV